MNVHYSTYMKVIFILESKYGNKNLNFEHFWKKVENCAITCSQHQREEGKLPADWLPIEAIRVLD